MRFSDEVESAKNRYFSYGVDMNCIIEIYIFKIFGCGQSECAR
jgi:hypothetical protein